MRIKLLVLTAIITTLMACNAYCSPPASASDEPPVINPKRAMVVDGVISGGNMEPLAKILMRLTTDKPVDLILNSPGGSVISGFLFISNMDAARARGLKIRCFVPTFAASMAFQILTHCDERYTLDKSFLLWHRARVSVGGMFGAAMTAPAAMALARDLESVDQIILRECLDTLNMATEDVKYHFENETLHVGSNLALMAPDFIKSYKYIPGLLEALRNEDILRTAKPGLFGVYRDGELVYVWDGVATDAQ